MKEHASIQDGKNYLITILKKKLFSKLSLKIKQTQKA